VWCLLCYLDRILAITFIDLYQLKLASTLVKLFQCIPIDNNLYLCSLRLLDRYEINGGDQWRLDLWNAIHKQLLGCCCSSNDNHDVVTKNTQHVKRGEGAGAGYVSLNSY
jgi:hypothetical protein